MHANTRPSERGAILMQVIIALLVLTGLSMFVVDFGVLWVSRNQVQNAADAGAHAGAVALAFDDFADHSNSGPAKTAARTYALENNIFGEKGDVQLSGDILFYSDDPSKFPATCSDDSCVRVDVYRNQARSNPLPMFFGPFVGLTQQGTRAMAIAQAAMANASMCLKPWAVADKWEENNPIVGAPWTPTETYDPSGAHPDRYQAPTSSDPGTGFTLQNDLGTELRLKVGSPHDAINPGWFQALDLTGGGGSQYRENISGCANHLWKIGDEIPKETGNMVGPTGQGTGDLIDLDPNATWDSGARKVHGSCVEDNSCIDAQGNHVQYAQSPRIVSIPVFDLDYYMATGGPGAGTVRVVNILGFFVDRIENPQNTVVGYLASKADLKIAGGGTITPTASFIKSIQLVR